MTTVHADPDPQHHPLHEQLLLAFLDSSLSLPQIAHHFALTLTALAVWVRSPRAQADIEGFRQLARYRAEVLADGALPAAVDTFIRINQHLANLEGPQDTPITVHLRLADTARKAATALARFTRVPPPAQQAGGRRSGDGPADLEGQPSTARVPLAACGQCSDSPAPPSTQHPTSHPRDHPTPLPAAA